jgi:hypothetical protein
MGGSVWAVALLLSALGGSGTQGTAACTQLSGGTIRYPVGHYLADQLVPIGFDPYGYNFQEHIFLGSYANAYLGADGLPPYQGDDVGYLMQHPEVEARWYWSLRKLELRMSWDEGWLSNRDCNGDQKLDRHPGFRSYLASGAELTNHISGGEGEGRWTHFSRIVAVPAGAQRRGDQWYRADGSPIGSVIWGGFAIEQEAGSGPGGIFVRPAEAGLGTW